MLVALGTLAGGLGLFLLGVSMITDGLKLAAGGALRDILGRSTRTTWHGIRTGFLLSSLVQSSSAVTIATIGFVNAGLLGIHQAHEHAAQIQNRPTECRHHPSYS